MNIKITLFLIFVLSQIIYANESTSSQKITAEKSNERIVIDGILNENIWQRPGFSRLLQQDPDQGEHPSQKSEIWVAYDDEALYFAGKFYDSNPDSIMARLVRRDFVWGDPSDGCILYIDSYRDKRSGYFFYVSAAGTLADGLLLNDSKNTDLSWDAVWEGVPKIDEDGWSVEMRIPLSQLRFKDIVEQVWGINVERYLSRRSETDMIAYTPRNESGFSSRFPELVGINGIKPSYRLEVLPYVTGKAEYLEHQAGDPYNSGKEFFPGIGADIKVGLGNSLTLDATINPDFGQVEVDPAIVNLTDVENTFQEKRPFFTEGVRIFRFGRGGTNNNVNFNWQRPNIFYSRRIGRSYQGSLPSYDYADVPSGTHILGAGKISGRIFNDWKIGMVNALTKREFAKIQLDGKKSEAEIEPLTYYGVFRAQKDFNSGNQGLGVLSTFTNRFFDDASLRNDINKDAFVGAADGWTFLDDEKTYVLSGWAGMSRVSGNKDRMIALQTNSRHYFQRPDVDHLGVDSNATSLSGYGGRFMLNKNRGEWTFNTAVGFVSPKFEINDVGFGSYSDKINAHFFTSYRWMEPTDYYQRAGLNAALYTSHDFGGNKTAQGYWFGGFFFLRTLYGANFSVSYNPESYNTRLTRGGPLTLNPISRSFNLGFFTDNRKWWVAFWGGSVQSSDASEYQEIFSDFEFKVSSTLTLSVGPQVSFNKSNTQYIGAWSDQTAMETFGNRYVFADIDRTTFSADIRADWIISPKLSFQVYVQPYITSGKYSEFKALKNPKTYNFFNYGEEGSSIEPLRADNEEITGYELDPDGEGPTEAHELNYNPDFNYMSLRGNAVLRWEYLPGSTLFLVWTQSRSDSESIGDFEFSRSMNNIFDKRPDNIFMLKLTYWFGM
ncbi:MAG: carbohydrate binding family 9 domain-containing protein [Ignavibacteriae bacterium]|nr:carbohydrate binding family 9 domain-containing protein [Ignavibacteriota bacterium]